MTMKERWARLLSNAGSDPEDKTVFHWMGGKGQVGYDQQEEQKEKETEFRVDGGPIEPDAKSSRRPSLFKWIFFLLIVLYGLLSYYHAPLLTRMGRYLIVEHPPAQADLIVCMMGENVDRGLAAADMFKGGLAPNVFLAREELPDGMAVLKEKGVVYPESRDLLLDMLAHLGVPRQACLTAEKPVDSTFEEVQVIREVALEKGFRSLIVVTSPIHTRRTYMTFLRAFEKEDVEIMMVSTRYSGFKPETWWKSHRYAQAVIVEYQKLIYYTVKYFW